MAVDIISLPSEMREQIYSYCDKRDLVRLSRCSQAYYQCVVHYLWEKVELPWKYVNDEQFTDTILKNLHLTKSLTFYVDSDDIWDDDVVVTWESVEAQYLKILNHCDSEKVEFFGAINVAIGHDIGMKYITDTLHNLKKLSLWNVPNISANGLSCLNSLQQLRTLCLCMTMVSDDDIAVISSAPALEELLLANAFILTASCLKSISLMTQLTSLTMTSTCDSTSNAWKDVAHLKNLVTLNLCDTTFNDDALEQVCLLLKHLKVLKVSSCKYISDDGLREIHNLTTLEVLDISHCSSVTGIGISYLQNMFCLKELNVKGCTESVVWGLMRLNHLTSLKVIQSDVYRSDGDSDNEGDNGVIVDAGDIDEGSNEED